MHVNKYGELLCDFLLSSDCCMLNGRNNSRDYYTYKDTSVIDYCLSPHHNLDLFKDFTVHRVDDMFRQSGLMGTVENPAQILPDHNLLTWSIDISAFTPEVVRTNALATSVPLVQTVRFNCSDVPNNFMASSENLRLLQICICRLEQGIYAQTDIDDSYNMFCGAIKNEMGENLPHRTISFADGSSARRRKIKKPYWNENLTALWSDHTKAQREFGRARGQDKQRLKALAKEKRKALDRAIQSEKRRYWRQMQTELLNLQSSDPKEYWKFVGRLGMNSVRKFRIPWEAVTREGDLVGSYEEVMSIWKEHFCTLLNNESDSCESSSTTGMLENSQDDASLDAAISMEEIKCSLSLAKNGKATGWDELPVEVLRNEVSAEFLHSLFNKCFETGVVPEAWSRSIINPIPKSYTADPREPAKYRGITLASSVYKLYAGILNRRLSRWAEMHQRISDEQNGFRERRGCVDHLNTLSQIIDSRKKRSMSTFVAFIDFSKAYDRISRALLWHKLYNHGISNKFLSALKSLYQDVKCCVRINGHKTDWFKVSTGLKQGCLISPLLFNLYINDLVSVVQGLNCGVPVDDELVSILLYADDIALVAPDENSLQRMLDCLNDWCLQWQLVVNIDKSQVVHFRRGPSVPRSGFNFKCGQSELQTVEKYRYLGLIFTEFLDFNIMSKAVAQAATRALGLLIAKCKAHGGVPFDVFTQLYYTLVQPIVDYGASVWGANVFSHIRSIQLRAGRFFLGVGRYTPNNAVLGEMGWTDPCERLWQCIFRQWYRMDCLSLDRLNGRVHAWALRLALRGIKNAYFKLVKFSRGIGAWDINNQVLKHRGLAMAKLNECFVSNWKDAINREEGARGVGGNKLRTYKQIKFDFGTTSYVKDHHLTRAQRSALAKFRCGVAPLRLETGRFEGMSLEERLCPLCQTEIETEVHSIIKCSAFNDLRTTLFNYCTNIYTDFMLLSDLEKFVFIFTSDRVIKPSSVMCLSLLRKRRELLYV